MLDRFLRLAMTNTINPDENRQPPTAADRVALEGLAKTLKLPTVSADEPSTNIDPAATHDGSVDNENRRAIRVSAGASASVSRFGGYELLNEISRGGMGVVYRARELRLNRIVALKMILAGELAGEDEVRRFQIEAEAAARLEHPCIVPIHEVGSVGNQHFYTMSFVEGAGLDQFQRRGVGDPTRAARIIQQVAEAVDHAHLHGIVHRDLKPANVLLDEDGFPRITDFGLAKRTDESEDLTRTGQILGTPGYMAPEQAAGDCDAIGPPADIYALGSLLYFTLTGRPPFQAANVIDTLVQSLESEPTMPRALNPLIPKPLEQICMRCLERAPADRYPSAQEVAKDLDRFLQGQPVHAHPPHDPRQCESNSRASARVQPRPCRDLGQRPPASVVTNPIKIRRC
jgi:serine/threonine protein kinase